MKLDIEAALSGRMLAGRRRYLILEQATHLDPSNNSSFIHLVVASVDYALCVWPAFLSRTDGTPKHSLPASPSITE